MAELPELYRLIRDAGIKAWQYCLTVPMGNAADNADVLLQPYELLDLYPMLAEIAVRDGSASYDWAQFRRDGSAMANPPLRGRRNTTVSTPHSARPRRATSATTGVATAICPP